MSLLDLDSFISRDRAPFDVELETFKKCLARGKTHRFAVELVVTPSVARFALNLNPENRRWRRTVIRAMVHDIENETFCLNGETIIMSSCGYVNDGQHRFQAIIESEKSVRVLVAFGYPRESRKTVDSNQAARTTSDYLHMAGVSESSDKSKIGSVLRMMEINHSYSTTSNSSRQATQAYCFDHMDEIEESMSVVNKADGKMLLNYQSLCALYILFKRAAGADIARTFMSKLQSGADLSSNSAIYVLRQRLIREKQVNKTNRDQINDMIELIIRCWNHYRAGTCPQKLLVMGDWPQISR